ncbi:MAG: YjcQ family protein [Desulfosporosinus sp.]|nr:YjcQ family protein [Desulfosporosinus sp.]
MDKKQIIYSVLREIEKGETIPTCSDFNISLIEFRDLIDQIQDDDLIKGASVPRGQGNPARMVLLNTAKITLKGLNYLEKNSALAETIPD